MWRSWVYVADHFAHKFDFFFKIDDDTLFLVPWMREILVEKQFLPTDHHYFGHRSFMIDKVRGLINGALVGFSRMTLVSLVETVYKKMPHEYGDRRNFKHHQCVDRDGATEEVTTSICVGKLGVEPEGLYDEAILPRRPHVLLWMARDLLVFTRRDNSSSWIYRHAPRDVGTELECCSYRPVGIHFMRLARDLLRMYDLIVDPDHKNELEEVVRTKVPELEVYASNPTKLECSVFDSMRMTRWNCIAEAKY